MTFIKLTLLLLPVVFLLAVALQNQAPWAVHFLWMSDDVPGFILLFIATMAGFIWGITVALLVKWRKTAASDEKGTVPAEKADMSTTDPCE